jgi:hypothetical protein
LILLPKEDVSAEEAMHKVFHKVFVGIIPALLTAATVGALDSVAVAAPQYPFCIRGCDFGAARGDCSFVSYQQCQATASGRDAWCDANPYYQGDAHPGRHNYSRRRL